MDRIFAKYSDFLLILTAFFWGSTFILMKKAIEDLPTFSFLFARFFLAFLLMLLIFYKKITLKKEDILAACILGFLNFIAYAAQTYSLNFVPSNIVAFITALFVVFTPIFSFLLFKRNIKIYSIIGVIIAVIGLYLLTLSGKLIFNVYEIYPLLCAIFFGMHVSVTDVFSKKYNIYTLVTFQFLVVAILSLLFVPFESHKIKITPLVIFALFITSFFATVFAFFVQTYAQKYTSPTKTAIIFALEPVTAAFFGIMYGEKLTLFQISGGFLVIFATIISEIGDKIIKLFNPKNY
ncbi:MULTISPECIES: DMT family transporter [unclassified Lebetimonas]|uniref:DMT family transporter n=1 Tax=unclassified Lebetimonas TaxID=2648158 RepID=UPI0004637635|nr:MULTISPECIES: DMT family transporter [unclassified Lebetimonas]